MILEPLELPAEMDARTLGESYSSGDDARGARCLSVRGVCGLALPLEPPAAVADIPAALNSAADEAKHEAKPPPSKVVTAATANVAYGCPDSIGVGLAIE